MKRAMLSGLLVMLVAGSALGQGADYLIKKKAMDVRDQNNAAQGVTPGASAPAAPAPSAPQGISPAQQAAIDKVQADLAAIKAGAAVTAAQKQALQADISNLAKGVTKPSKTTLTKLVEDITAALADKAVTAKDKDQAQLAKDLNIVVNSGNLAAAQTQTYMTALSTSLKGCGVGEQPLTVISNDLKAITKDLQNSKPKLYQ
jgi:hypothetical protein